MSALLLILFLILEFLFLGFLGMAVEFIDRKLYARMQNRIGPPWFQPFADFVKLVAKEDIIPEEANPMMFKLMPVLALTAVFTAFLHIPLWDSTPLISFNGSVIVIVYLLTIPTLTFFLGGWHSTSLFSMIGAVRTLTQLFAYEVPLLLSVLAPAILAHTWSIEEMSEFYSKNPLFALTNAIGSIVAMIALQGKLERVPFDMPEAETEIVGGTFTEYSGRLLAMFRLAIDMETVVGASLIVAVFLPFGLHSGPLIGFVLYLAKILLVILLLALLRTVTARLRIEQMVVFCWKYLAPAALVQIIISLTLNWIIK
ncbi:MAG: NADH-quinone oxidoreductase subunit H [Kiritimatiellae bacterium]|nr:NADH-quinone oxidoreductase subunit H [Kiritimatiellia bacterium]MDD5520705.1 NADH-quinone oxidoreductase subunit H [Kiritimatiellia bacterium]